MRSSGSILNRSGSRSDGFCSRRLGASRRWRCETLRHLPTRSPQRKAKPSPTTSDRTITYLLRYWAEKWASPRPPEAVQVAELLPDGQPIAEIVARTGLTRGRVKYIRSALHSGRMRAEGLPHLPVLQPTLGVNRLLRKLRMLPRPTLFSVLSTKRRVGLPILGERAHIGRERTRLLVNVCLTPGQPGPFGGRRPLYPQGRNRAWEWARWCREHLCGFESSKW
jgi:hypothetical protein